MAFEKHLLIDGANVLHACPELRPQLRRHPAQARAMLVRRVTAIHDAEAVRVTVVFDGRGTNWGREQPTAEATFNVLYTPANLTADDAIEQWVAQAAAPAQCHVATADQAERSTVEAAGGVWLPPADLFHWIERAEQQLQRQLRRVQTTATRDWSAQPTAHTASIAPAARHARPDASNRSRSRP